MASKQKNLPPRHISFARRLLTGVLVLLIALGMPHSASAQEPSQTSNQCYVVADGYAGAPDDAPARDTLAFLRLETGETQSVNGEIPNLPTSNIEAIAFKPNSTDLYAANGGQVGIIDIAAATFAPLPNPVDSTGKYNDIDGLSFDPLTGKLWGVHASYAITTAGIDVLLEIDASTGISVTGTAIEIKSGDPRDHVDDLAIDPVDGTFYAVITLMDPTRAVALAPSRLVTIDPATGNVTRIGVLTNEATEIGIEEMEGLGFGGDGELYGSTGSAGNEVNRLWRIDKQTAVATPLGQFDAQLNDIEALDCLSSGGFIVFESYLNGLDADNAEDAVVVRAGDPITQTYLVRNTGVYTATGIQVTDDNGTPADTNDDQIACQGFSLAPGQSNEDAGVSCQLTGSAQPGQHTHLATMTASDSIGGLYNQQDANTYIAYQGAAVGGRVWHDLNRNGIQDPAESESGVDGVEVTLYDSADNPVANTQTDNGTYLFNELQPGDYSLAFQLPDGFEFTSRDQGDDDDKDSDADPDPNSATFGRTAIFTLSDGAIDQTWDAGLTGEIQPASLAGYVWEDLNGDGIQNDGEPNEVGVAGVAVALHDNTSAITQTVSGADGSFSFTGVAPGDYSLVFTLPAGYTSFTRQNQGDSEALDSDAHPETGRTGVFSLQAGQQATQWDAGVAQAVTIGDYVWEDVNENGVQNDGEPGVDGVTVTLLYAGDAVTSTVTANGGLYQFATDETGKPLLPGQYQIEFSLPDGFTFTAARSGEDSAVDSDPDPATGRTDTFTVVSGSSDLTWDAGMHRSSSSIHLPQIYR